MLQNVLFITNVFFFISILKLEIYGQGLSTTEGTKNSA